MITRLDEIDNILTDFYDFTDKKVLHVGAGGGQLIDYATHARHVFAIDIDDSALDALRRNIDAQHLGGKFTIRKQDYYAFTDEFDVTFFDFCLHEMADPVRALEHARQHSREILIIDHVPESKWAWYVGETELAQNSWKAINQLPIRKQRVVETEQVFGRFEDLQRKLAVCGDVVQNRIATFTESSDFTIPMYYGLALI